MSQRKCGVILSYVQIAVSIAVNLLYVPILLRSIGQNEYGLYQIVGSIIAYLNIMESLISGSVSRFYCKFHVEGKEREKENTLAIARRIYHVLSVVLLIFGIFAYFAMKKVYRFSFTKHEMSEAGIMLAAMILNIVINMQCYVYSAAITANEKFLFAKLSQISMSLIQPIAVIMMVFRCPHAASVVIAQVVVNITINMIRVLYCKAALGVKIKYHYRDWKLTKSMLELSAQLMLAMLADIIFWKADQLILGVLGTSTVAIYAIGAQIYSNYSPVGTAVSGVFLPRITQLYKEDKKMKSISDYFIKVGRISFEISGLILSGFILFGQEFVQLWAGKSYEQAYYVALLVMIPITIEVIQHLGLTILQVVDKYRFRSIVYIISAIVNIVLTILFVKKWGIIGAALSTCITIIICHGIIMNWYYYSKIGLDIKNFWINMKKILLSIVIACVIGFVIRCISVNNACLQLVFHIVIYSVIYFFLIYFLAMNSYEKLLVCNVIKNRRG